MEDKFKIHIFYILVILISVIVVLITVKWNQIPNLADLLTFALTLSSLILSALAIGYAVYSNTSFSQNIFTLNKASRDLSKTAKNISDAAIDLGQKISFIPPRLESMEVKVDQTHLLLKQYAEQREAPPKTKKEKEALNEIVDSFLDETSFSGLLVLYACSLAYTKKVSFSLFEMSKSLPSNNYRYYLGFLIAASSVGLVLYKHNEAKNIYNITYINGKLMQGLQPELHKRVSGDEDQEFKQSCIEDINAVEKYMKTTSVQTTATKQSRQPERAKRISQGYFQYGSRPVTRVVKRCAEFVRCSFAAPSLTRSATCLLFSSFYFKISRRVRRRPISHGAACTVIRA